MAARKRLYTSSTRRVPWRLVIPILKRGRRLSIRFHMLSKMTNRAWLGRGAATVLAGFLAVVPLLAQDEPLTSSSVRIDLPVDSPVAMMKYDTGTSRTSSRGAALVL